MLEQYYLLDPRFTLNTQRIVNLREKQGNAIYIYNKYFTMLYHIGLSYAGLSREIGINQSSIKTSLDTGELYLGYFAIVTEPQIGADKSNMTLQELNNFIEEKRKEVKSKNRAASLYLYDKDSTILYHSAISQSALQSDLGIAPGGVRRCIKEGSLLFDCFVITEVEVSAARHFSSLSLTELKELVKGREKSTQWKALN